MQDPRLRLISVICLSIAAFTSVLGAVMTLIWLLLSPGSLLSHLRSAAFWIIIIVTGIIASVSQYTGGEGISYFIRMSVLILLAFTIYSGWRPGEYLDLSVWLFGNKAGFDIGLAVEMSIQGLHDVSREFKRIVTAHTLKGRQPGISSIPSVGFLLIHGRLMRAQDQADLLISRGYVQGGSCCPVFRTPKKDIFAGCCAVLILILSFIPVRDIFILQI
jgi:energy-coupling factor transport system permease protein